MVFHLLEIVIVRIDKKKEYMVCIKSIGNNFFLTWLYVAARSHRAGSVVRSLTFKTRQASVACERLFRLNRVFSEPLPSNSVQAQNAASDWVNRVRRRWAWFAKLSSLKIWRIMPNVSVPDLFGPTHNLAYRCSIVRCILSLHRVTR